MTGAASASRWACAAGLVVAALMTVAASSPALGLALLALGLVALAVGPRLALGTNGQATLSFAALVLAVVGATLAAPDEELPRKLSDRALLFSTPPLAVALVRALIAAPIGGVRFTLVLLVVALTGTGRSHTGWAYPAAVAVFVAAAGTALARDLHGRLGAGELPRRARDVAVLALALVLTGGVAIGMAQTLPRLQALIVERFMRSFRDRAGFSASMWLGSLHGLLESDLVVLRVHSGDARYLRGAVFRRYGGQVWDAAEPASRFSGRVAPTEPGVDAPANLVEIEMARPMERYFAPLGTDVLALSSGSYERNDAGVLAPTRGDRAKRLWLAPTPGDDRRDVASDLDRLVPTRPMPLFNELLARWGATREVPVRQRLARIEHALTTEYGYSLRFDRTEGVDPLIDFLATHKQGHCEYFASAMVLLARTSGVPARLVTGFRADERSPLGDYLIVRDRDAHAWVEAWVDGQWETFDPTPPGPLESPPTPLWGALGDWMRVRWGRFDDWLGRRTPPELAFVLVALFGAWLVVRLVRGSPAPRSATRHADEPLAAWRRLEEALVRRGIVRPPSETLTRFAARVCARDDLPAELREGVAELVGRYEALRYGNLGDPEELERDVERWVDRSSRA